jgi:hypothetical protein
VFQKSRLATAIDWVVMGIVEDFIPLRNECGAVTDTGKVSQNDVLFSAIYVLALVQNLDEIPEDELDRLRLALERYIRPDGFTRRTPVSDELESNDNEVGWGLLSAVLRPAWAANLLAALRHNGWLLPPTGTATEGQRFSGRFLSTRAHLEIAAQERPDWIEQFFWCLAVVVSMFKSAGDQDNFTESYIMIWTPLYLSKTGVAVPASMVITAYLWKLVWWLRGLTMRQNLVNYGWRVDSPFIRWIR